MADLKIEFNEFHKKIVLTSAKKESLRKSRDAIRDRIRKFFLGTLEVEAPKFFGQGSYAMGTTVNPLDGEFDIDDGVYLQNLDKNDDSNWPNPETVHRWLVKATENHTNEKPTDKRTCVRVRYAGQYHVDLPAYAELNDAYMLAEKGAKGWHGSDAKAVTNWFKEEVKEQGDQLRRIVRYLKAWSDFQAGRRGKMPSGLILTVLAVQNMHKSERDDVSLANVALAISDSVNPIFYVYNPVDIDEVLTERLSDAQKSRFQEAISDLASDAADAIDTDDCEKASALWRQQFGDRFPAVKEKGKDSQKQEDVAKLIAAYVTKRPVKPWGYTS